MQKLLTDFKQFLTEEVKNPSDYKRPWVKNKKFFKRPYGYLGAVTPSSAGYFSHGKLHKGYAVQFGLTFVDRVNMKRPL